MSEVLSSIGTFLGSGAGQGVLKAGTVGGGFLQNWLANREAQKKQNFVEQLVSNPAKWNAFVASKEQPLQAGLTTDVARSTDAYGAERGLGSSPAVMKDVYAQALAPYIQNEQQMAQNAAINSLGIYEGSPTTKPVDITSMLKMFLNPNKPGQTPINAGPPQSIPSSGGYGGWVGPTQDPPTGDSGLPGTLPQPFDYASLIDNANFGATQ